LSSKQASHIRIKGNILSNSYRINDGLFAQALGVADPFTSITQLANSNGDLGSTTASKR
jgi:hypothetical protein